MKFLFTADIHLSGYSQDKIVNNLPERLNSIKNVLIEMAEYCKQHDISTFIIGGDTLHGKSIIHALAQSIMLDFFRAYAEDIEFIILDGNHDLSGRGKDSVSALKSLDNEPNVMRVGDTQTFGDILLVPYMPHMVDVIKKNKAKYLISHFGLSEGVLNNGMSVISDVSLADLDGKYRYVLLGHYHKPQSIIKETIDLYYVGSPIQIDWGEKNEEKRFLIVDTDNDKIESVPTTGYTKYCEFTITNENKDDLLKEVAKLKDEGHMVKIVKDEDVNTSDIEEDYVVIDRREKDITNRGITSSMSMTDKLTRFLEIKEIPKDNRDDYINIAQSIIEDSK